MTTTTNTTKTLNEIYTAGTNTLVVDNVLTHEAMMPYIKQIEGVGRELMSSTVPKRNAENVAFVKGFSTPSGATIPLL